MFLLGEKKIMKKVILDKKGLQQLLSNKSLSKEGNVFNVDDRLYKISKGYFFDILNDRRLAYNSREVNVEQIKWLSSMTGIVTKSRLPNGIIEYKDIPIGVIYPYCFEDYKDFNSLSSETSELILDNIRVATENTINLFEADIYNTDLVSKNILFQNKDVQLIDLDGKYIKNSLYADINDVYTYFLASAFEIIVKKLHQQYPDIDVKKIASEIRPLFLLKTQFVTPIDYPIQVINKIEKMRILK